MIVVVTGGRDFTGQAWLNQVLDQIHSETPITLLVQGGQVTTDHKSKVKWGADYFAKLWAMSRNVPYETEPANWGLFGLRAGPIRNRKMLDGYKPDLVVAFPGGKGTANCVSEARARGIEVREVR